jgi:hypothetical protein
MEVGPLTLIASSCEPGAAGATGWGGGVEIGGVEKFCGIVDVPEPGDTLLGGVGLNGDRFGGAIWLPAGT